MRIKVDRRSAGGHGAALLSVERERERDGTTVERRRRSERVNGRGRESERNRGTVQKPVERRKNNTDT